MEMASDIGRIPTVASGSETTYECDGLWFNNTIVAVALFGGFRGDGSKCGLSYWYVNDPAAIVNTNVVASLSCKRLFCCVSSGERGDTPAIKGGSEGLPSEVSGMTRIFHDDGNGRHIRHKQKKIVIESPT